MGGMTRWQSKRYLAWVKSLHCICCGQPADDAHHVVGLGMSGMGMKAPDYATFPLCRGHHSELHQDPVKWRSTWGSQAEWALRTLGIAIERGLLIEPSSTVSGGADDSRTPPTVAD